MRSQAAEIAALKARLGPRIRIIHRILESKPDSAVEKNLHDQLAEHAINLGSNKISKIYNRWHYLPQMKAALSAYEKQLAALIAGR
jgi:hypothetical protein